jgi:Ti-type conjugative transfer relaxase TraA
MNAVTAGGAIGFGRMRSLKRRHGDNAVRTDLYNRRAKGRCERTGQQFCYDKQVKPVHHAVLLPEGAKPEFSDSSVLWNAVEAAERRKDAQVARELVLALPASEEVSHEDRVELTHRFAHEHFVSKGVAVQIDIHEPDRRELVLQLPAGKEISHEDRVELVHRFANEHLVSKGRAVQIDIHAPKGEGPDGEEGVNWHAHLLITTRRVGREGLAPNKARDLDPVIRSVGGRSHVVAVEPWGELWALAQNRYFREQGMRVRVDANSVLGQIHVGPHRLRVKDSSIVKQAEERRLANIEAARDPRLVLEALTRYNATFTKADLDRFLAKQLGRAGVGGNEIARVRKAVLESPDAIALYDPETGAPSGRLTTHAVRDEERAAIAVAAELGSWTSGGVSAASAAAAVAGRPLREDQVRAFEQATGPGHLKLIEGRAGTGKSFTLGAIREAYEADGKRVVGLAPTNVVAQDMAADGFKEAGTVHSALFQLKNGRAHWTADTVVMLDEAAMLDTPITAELLKAVSRAGAKLILVGDDRQLSSIERGGLFSELLTRHGSAEITEVSRQQVDWQRQAARDLAQYKFGEAVDAFERGGAIHWSDKQDQAMAALVEAWKTDLDASGPGGARDSGGSRFVFAYTNGDVDALNSRLRAVCREHHKLSGADVPLQIICRNSDGDEEERTAPFAKGDRVQFTQTSKKQSIYNGNVGTITSIDAATGIVTARLDAAAGRDGREVSWNARQFQGFRHGYAGTVYKGQGKTLEQTYLYHSRHWNSAASYVALTRQRQGAALFVARETAADLKQLAQQMAQTETRSASLAWATSAELAGAPPAIEHAAQARDPAPARGHAHEEQPAATSESQPGGPAGSRGAYEAWRKTDAARRTLDLIAAWDRLIERYRTQLPNLGQSLAYDEARNRLKAFGRLLARRPAQLAELRRFEAELGIGQRPALKRIASSPDPARETARLIHDAEQQQQGRPLEDRHADRASEARAQLRRRPRDDRTRGR